MEYLLILSVFLLGAAHISYLCRFQIRRWWRGNVVNRDLPPHERWPEVLQWQKGDVFELRGAYCGQATLVSVTEGGSAYVMEGIGGQDRPEKWAISSLVGHNRSLRSRYINAEMRRTNEYMELLEEFNKAVKELERRDKNLRLVG